MFHHDVEKHAIVFGAVANIVHLKIRLGGNWNVDLVDRDFSSSSLCVCEMNYIAVDCCVVVVYD